MSETLDQRVDQYDADQHVDLDLDAVERERGDVKPLFAFVAGGKRYTLSDPASLDWKELLEIEDPVAFFKFCMPAEQKEDFKALDLEGWRLGKLVEAFQKHYGIGSKGNGAASRI